MITVIKKKITQIKLLSILIILIGVSSVFALSYTSSNYVLKDIRIVSSGGKALSSNYALDKVRIGSAFGKQAQSANYRLDATNIEEIIALAPNPPTVNPVTSPTNNPIQTLSGTKGADTSIYINGFEAVPLDSSTTWNYDVTLTEGTNDLVITSRNQQGLESDSVYVSIVLDTIPPLVIISSPQDGTVVATPTITLEGTIDGVPFSEPRTLQEGSNTLTKQATDPAGNTGSAAITVTLDSSPPSTPVVTDDGVYTTSTSQLHATWSSSDPETGVVEYQYAIGTTAGGTDVVGWTSVGIQTEVTHSGLSLTQGQMYYISVQAKNGAGGWSPIGTSDGIKVNQTIPAITDIQPPNASRGYSEDNISFSVSAQDADGDSLLYQFSIDETVIVPWQGSPNLDWPTSGVNIGIHTMKVEVSDNNGGIISQNVELCLFRKPVFPPAP